MRTERQTDMTKLIVPFRKYHARYSYVAYRVSNARKKVCPLHAIKEYRGSRGTAPLILTSVLECSTSLPVTLTLGTKPHTHWIEGLVSPRAGLDVLEKRQISYFCRDSNPGLSCPQRIAILSTPSRTQITSAEQFLKLFTKHYIRGCRNTEYIPSAPFTQQETQHATFLHTPHCSPLLNAFLAVVHPLSFSSYQRQSLPARFVIVYSAL
jgi:hypothetical protein